MSERDLSSELRRLLSGPGVRHSQPTHRATTLLEEIGIGIGVDVAPRRTVVETALEPEAAPRAELARTLPLHDVAAAAAQAPEQPPLQRRYGRFEPVGVLGQGSMGIVLEAQDPELGRTVALKLLRNARQVSDAAVARFVAEARLTAQLDHPGIVPVHELGVTDDGVLFFVMQKVRGRSLRELLDALAGEEDRAQSARNNRHRLLSMCVQICQALAYAHERGVVHRDLKPENIMVGDYGEVVVMDWGVARIPELAAAMQSAEADTTSDAAQNLRPRTLHGTAIGTPGYMSPEQALGELERLGPHSDVFSLGCILYELLTLEPAYQANNAIGLMSAAIGGAPLDPVLRAPQARVPRELADLCLLALAREPSERTTALQLARALGAYLEGSAAREQAVARVREARTAWRRHGELLDEREDLRRRQAELEARTPPWTPPDLKRDLLDVRARLRTLAGELADAYEEVVAGCERALSHDRRHRAAHALLADAYWQRLEEAARRGDAQAARHYAWRVRAHDQGEYAELLDGAGRLSLATEPSGARVYCQSVQRSGLVWTLGEPRLLGETPLVDVALAYGSYLLRLVTSEHRDTLYPVHVHHGRRHWRTTQPVPLYGESEIGAGWCYVPRGPFVCGGDPQAIDAFERSEPELEGFFIAELPVTSEAYCEFLNAIHARDPEEAWRRTPREISGRGVVSLGQHWHRPAAHERYVVPESDRGGDRWDPRWPVIAVSWDDAQAFAAWRSEVTGELHRLPLELEWEKAARGVDGRALPWGDEFDATLCLMRDSRPVNRLPDVVGAVASDVSIYGVRDMAGSVGEWCGESSHRGDTGRRLVRGGSWLSGARRCRAASRDVLDLSWVYPSVGFRLMRPISR